MTSRNHSVWAYEPPAGREPVRQQVKISGLYETVVYRFDPPAGAPEGKLPVVMVHGIQSHPGWYARSSLALADAGHTVYLPTRFGCGENTVCRGGGAGIKPLDRAMDRIADHVQTETGCEKMHFVGISWGGKHLSISLADKKRAARAETLTLLCPGIVAKIKPPLPQRIGQAVFPVLGLFLMAVGCLTPLALALVLSMDERNIDVIGEDIFPLIWILFGISLLPTPWFLVLLLKFPIPLDDPALFTDNPDRREYLATNPETLHKVTGAFGMANRRMDQRVRKGRKLSMPTTLVLSERDRIIDNEKTIPIVQAMQEDVKIVTLPGCHTLEFEEDITPLVDAILASFGRGES